MLGTLENILLSLPADPQPQSSRRAVKDTKMKIYRNFAGPILSSVTIVYAHM
jgi:hypothetical protein